MDYGIPALMMTNFTALNDRLQAAWTASNDPATRTRGTVAARDQVLAEMKAAAKNLVSIIQGTPTVTDQMKIDAGLTVRKAKPTPKPTPTLAPILIATMVDAGTMTLELRQSRTKRGKPADIGSALVFIATGPVAPQDPSGWKFYTTTTLTTVTVTVPPSTTGQTVWATAFWCNPRGESGPSAAAVKAVLPAGEVLPKAESKLRIAKAA